jgi:hypothetical protein
MLQVVLARERVREAAGVIRVMNRDKSDNLTPSDATRLLGQYMWEMDQALPGKHTLLLYGALTSNQAATLIQARTGHGRLNRYAVDRRAEGEVEALPI